MKTLMQFARRAFLALAMTAIAALQASAYEVTFYPESGKNVDLLDGVTVSFGTEDWEVVDASGISILYSNDTDAKQLAVRWMNYRGSLLVYFEGDKEYKDEGSYELTISADAMKVEGEFLEDDLYAYWTIGDDNGGEVKEISWTIEPDGTEDITMLDVITITFVADEVKIADKSMFFLENEAGRNQPMDISVSDETGEPVLTLKVKNPITTPGKYKLIIGYGALKINGTIYGEPIVAEYNVVEFLPEKKQLEIFQLGNSAGELVMITNMSANGKYAVSATLGDQTVDNPLPAGGSIINLENREVKAIPTPSGWASVRDVADNGIVAGECEGLPAIWDPSTQEWTMYEVPEPWDCGAIISITADAKYAVGYLGVSSDYMKAAPLYIDIKKGEVKELKNLPVVDLAGEDKEQNVFFGVSPDGKYALGQMSSSYLMPVSMFSYIYDLDNDTWKPIGYTYNESSKTYISRVPDLHFIDTQKFSRDGKWVVGTAYMVQNGGQSEGGSEFHAAYRYNVADDAMEEYVATDDQEVAGCQITNDGVIIGSAPAGNPYPTALVRRGDYFISFDQIFAQAYDTSLYNFIRDNVTGNCLALSADGLTAVMGSYDNCYVLRMPEPFIDAAAKVDLLATYVPEIPNGSTLSTISEIKITFDRAVAVYNQPSKIKLLDGQGNEVRSASGFSVSAANNHKVVIAFRSTKLNDGENYSIVIPEGMIWIDGDTSIKAKEITLNYVGRADAPVQPLKVSPADGAAVAQFNVDPDCLSITFDTPIAVSDNASCALYNDDNGDLIANFLCSVSGSTAKFYPTSTYRLYKGSNYRVEIAAGSITDLSGLGGNEEIVLHYSGAYVRELSSDDMYIFNANCDTYEYFMMWKNEVHTPAAIPASWNFTADNIWMLVRDSEESTDQALAAHSMFTPAAQSDDWLVTPQLYIPDNNAYLAFDAQSYLASKSDVLRVYVYSTDEVYNYIYAEQTELMRNDGQLVLEETLTPGASQETLAGEWTRYTVDLADYAGKNIYIAFVNYNYDQSAIFLDNVQVVRTMDFVLTNQTPASVVDKDEVAVKGIVSVGSEIAEFQGIELTLKDAQGAVVDAIADESAALAYGDVYAFEFAKALPLVPGDESAYSIEVKSGDSQAVFMFAIKDLAFELVKKVVLEEYTGSDCGNCPLGIRAIENLEETYPDNFIPVTIRTYASDPLGDDMGDYSLFLGLESIGAPSGRVNRGEGLAPMYQTSNGLTFSGKGLVDESGNEIRLWADAVQEELETPAEAEVSFTVSYDDFTGDITVPCQVRFALNSANRSIGVFAVMLEDGLSTKQANYFASIDDPLLGEWGLGGMYGSQTVRGWKANDVARHIISDGLYNGQMLEVGNFAAGETYSLTLESNIPENHITDPANCKVAVMLIDNGTQRILNAQVAAFNDDSGITDAIIGGDGEAVYYNLQGVKVQNPAVGQIYIKVQNGKSWKVKM